MARSIHPVIPDTERFCIWMDAGIVDYQLCTSGFRCEGCTVDRQMRRHHQRPAQQGRGASDASGAPTAVYSSQSAQELCASTLESVVGSIKQRAFPEDRRYASNHTWAKKQRDGSVLIGVDHFIGSLLTGVHAVACSMPETQIRAMQPCAWIVSGGATLSVSSPVSGTLLETNTSLAAASMKLHADPYGEGWIARIAPEDSPAGPALSASAAMATRISADCTRYKEAVNAGLAQIQVQLEGTMFDGGVVLDNFEAILGTEQHYAIIERFLHAC